MSGDELAEALLELAGAIDRLATEVCGLGQEIGCHALAVDRLANACDMPAWRKEGTRGLFGVTDR